MRIIYLVRQDQQLIMTGFDSDWENFFVLRDASSAHPQAFELVNPLHIEFEKRKAE